MGIGITGWALRIQDEYQNSGMRIGIPEWASGSQDGSPDRRMGSGLRDGHQDPGTRISILGWASGSRSGWEGLSCSNLLLREHTHRASTRWVWNFSGEGHSTPVLVSVPVCGRCTGKKFFLMSRQNLVCISLCPFPRVPVVGTTRKSLAGSSWHPPLNTYTH